MTFAAGFRRDHDAARLARSSPHNTLVGSIALALAVLVYIATLHLIHEHWIAPNFSYLQYTYRQPDVANYALAILLAVTLALILPHRISKPSHFVAWTLFVVTVVPSIIVPQFTTALGGSDAIEVSVWVWASYLPVAALGTRRAVRGLLPSLRMQPVPFWTAVITATTIICIYIAAETGLQWELPSLDEVYTVREDYSAQESANVALGYLISPLAYVLGPLIIARGVFTRRVLWILAGLIIEIFIYSFTGFRSALLSPIALVTVFVLLRRESRAAVAALLGVSAIATMMWVMDWLTSSLDYTSILVRRLLITPGLLTAAYVSVFSGVDKANFAHSFLSRFFDYPYSVQPPELVGGQFFGHSETNANASLLADGYANFGFSGMIVECLVLTAFLWVLDDACEGLPLRVTSFVLVMPTLALADSALFTTMLTHGFLAAVVVCVFLPTTGWTSRAKVDQRQRGRKEQHSEIDSSKVPITQLPP